MTHLLSKLQELRRSQFASNAAWVFVGRGCDVVLLGTYFIFLAHLLGPKEYGIFAGAFAFVGIAMPYSALGSGMLFMRYVSTAPEKFPEYWGNILFSTLGVGSLLTVGLHLVAPRVLNSASAALVMFVAAGNCIFGQLIICMSQIFQAFDQLRMTAMLTTLGNLLRLLTVVLMALVWHHATAQKWALCSLLGSLLASAIGCVIVTLRFGKPQLASKLFFRTMREGLGFSFAGSAQSAYNDIDKAMLSHYGMNVQNGIYTMAYRIADVATTPISAIDSAALPRYFRQAEQSTASVKNMSARIAKRTALLGFVMAAGMFLAAPLIPRILGQGFVMTAFAMRWLCLLPIFRGIHQLTGSAITGLGFQRYRTASQFVAASLNVFLNLWWIPIFGWLGAAWASLVTDGSLALINCVVLRALPGRRAALCSLEFSHQGNKAIT